MGNFINNEKDSDEKLEQYLFPLNFVRKEHCFSLDQDIDVYRQAGPNIQEDLIILVKMLFEEKSQNGEEQKQMLKNFKNKINQRKQLEH